MDAIRGRELDRALWRTSVRTGHALNVVIAAVNLAYVASTWRTGPNRPLLLVLNLVGIVGLAAALRATPDGQPHDGARLRALVAWWVGGPVLLGLAIWADGGTASPLAWMLPARITFTAMVHRPQVVVLSGVGSCLGYVANAIVDQSAAAQPGGTIVRCGYLVILTYAACAAAQARWQHLDGQAELRDHLELLADHDGLTGLLNHRAFNVRVRAAVEQASVAGTSVALLLVDLDHFKAINDRHGHAVGDEVLAATAGAIAGAVRRSDVVGRVGGEEFAVYLGEVSAEEALAAGERIRAAVAALTEPQPVTASIGLGMTGVDAPDASALLAQADRALYTAKRQGRNRTCALRVA